MIPDYTQFVKHDAMPNKKEDSPAPSEASIASSTPVMSGATVDIRKSPDRASVVGPSAVSARCSPHPPVCTIYPALLYVPSTLPSCMYHLPCPPVCTIYPTLLYVPSTLPSCMYHLPCPPVCTIYPALLYVPSTLPSCMYHLPCPPVCTIYPALLYVPSTLPSCMYHLQEELKRQLEKFVLDVQNDDSLSHVSTVAVSGSLVTSNL